MLGVFPEVVQYDVNNEPEGIDYPNITAVLAKGVQELDSGQQDLNAQVQQFRAENALMRPSCAGRTVLTVSAGEVANVGSEPAGTEP